MRGQQTRWSWSIRSVVAILTTMVLLSGLTMTTAPVSAASGPTVYWGVKSGPIDLPASKLAERQVWRDRRLMALAVHKRQADEDIGK